MQPNSNPWFVSLNDKIKKAQKEKINHHLRHAPNKSLVNKKLFSDDDVELDLQTSYFASTRQCFPHGEYTWNWQE